MSDTQRLRIVVLGYIVRGPIGGLAWHHLQYVLGLRELGHDVYFIEDSDDYPSCYDPARGVVDTDPTYGLHFAARAFERLGFGEQWCYYNAHTDSWMGPLASRVREVCESAELLLNLSGVNPLRSWLAEVPRRAFVDTDPAFTQIRHLTDSHARALAATHNSFFTFAANIERADCLVPADGFAWQPTRQPVQLDAWAVTPGQHKGSWTTVMQWDSYRALEYEGRRYGMKSDSFELFVDLPARAGRIFEIALGSESAPRDLLRAKDWRLLDPLEVTRDPWSYQEFIRGSKAEWSVAKQGYVASRSGWFSERSAAYLASGRPVLTQETGFSDWLQTGAGLLAFETMEEALAGMEEIDAAYEHHCRAARELVETFFDARKVLTHLIERALCVSVVKFPTYH
ncbi:MAG TPA: hypothetical protein VN844_23020 [Pyrinomonadaceae bacterium]|nr:hypothetical protein [Pyrinomonadaceae bacterium]